MEIVPISGPDLVRGSAGREILSRIWKLKASAKRGSQLISAEKCEKVRFTKYNLLKLLKQLNYLKQVLSGGLNVQQKVKSNNYILYTHSHTHK